MGAPKTEAEFWTLPVVVVRGFGWASTLQEGAIYAAVDAEGREWRTIETPEGWARELWGDSVVSVVQGDELWVLLSKEAKACDEAFGWAFGDGAPANAAETGLAKLREMGFDVVYVGDD